MIMMRNVYSADDDNNDSENDDEDTNEASNYQLSSDDWSRNSDNFNNHLQRFARF